VMKLISDSEGSCVSDIAKNGIASSKEVVRGLQKMYEESILSKATRQQFMRHNVLFKQLTKKRVEFFTD